MSNFSRADLAAARKLRKFVLRLDKTHAPQGWWPRVVGSRGARSTEHGTLAVLHNPPGRKYWHCKTKAACAFEVAVGAILTQNTAWSNVERALSELARKDLLDSRRLAKIPPSRLEPVIRSSGYYKQKAKKLKLFAQFVEKELGGDLRNILKNCRLEEAQSRPKDLYKGPSTALRFAQDDMIAKAREKLLSLWGIGRETADTILLFALDQPVFVVDAYTRRLLEKLTGDPHWLIRPYDEIRELCESVFLSGYRLPTGRMACAPTLIKHRQDVHALIVAWGKEMRKPRLNQWGFRH